MVVRRWQARLADKGADRVGVIVKRRGRKPGGEGLGRRWISGR